MKRLIAGLGICMVLFGSTQFASAEWFEMLKPPDRTEAGHDFERVMNQFCGAYYDLKDHKIQMDQAKVVADYTKVAQKYSFVSTTVAEATHAELQAMFGIAGLDAQIVQICGKGQQ